MHIGSVSSAHSLMPKKAAPPKVTSKPPEKAAEAPKEAAAEKGRVDIRA